MRYNGIYSRGDKKGKGMEYYENGKIKFDGIYSYRNKKGIEYYENGNIKYEGEYLWEECKNGKVKEYYIMVIYNLMENI